MYNVYVQIYVLTSRENRYCSQLTLVSLPSANDAGLSTFWNTGNVPPIMFHRKNNRTPPAMANITWRVNNSLRLHGSTVFVCLFALWSFDLMSPLLARNIEDCIAFNADRTSVYSCVRRSPCTISKSYALQIP